MSATNKSQTGSWSNLIKQQIKVIKKAIVEVADEEDIPIVVLPPKPTPNQKKREKSALDFYLNRVRFRNADKTIDLIQQSKPANTNDSVQIVNNPGNIQPASSVSVQKKQKQDEKSSSAVINLDDQTSKNQNIQKYKKNMFGASYKQTKLPVSIPVRNTNQQISKQIKVIDQMNKPEWLRQKEQRRAINKQKYPNSYTHSYEFNGSDRFSGFGHSDIEHKNFLQKRQKDKEKNKQKREAQKAKKKEEQLQNQKKRIQEQNAEYVSVLNGLVGIDPSPKKKVKLDEVDVDAAENGEATLANKEVLNQVIAAEQQSIEKVQEVFYKKQKRVGAKDIIKYQTSAPNLINLVLKHNYGEDILKPQNKKIPDYFPDHSTYLKTFHYLISNQIIAQISHKLRMLQKTGQDPIKIIIKEINTNVDGQVELALSQKESQENGGIQLKNYSLSRNRIGLICSSKQYRRQYYGVPSKAKKQFAFLVFLITPTNNDELNKQVRASTKIKGSYLEDILRVRRSKEVYFFDLDKISTILREYLAVSNLMCSQLGQSILDPSQVQKQVGNFVQNKEILDDILNSLKDIFNETQWLSIREMVLREKGFVLLQGPPGTGKTSTLMGLLSAQYEYLKKTNDNRKIMICAPSNAAVDHITKRIIQQGLMTGEGEIVRPKILRTGIVETQDLDVRSVSLDDQCEKIMMQNKEQAEKMNQMSTIQIKQKILVIQNQMRRLGIKTKQIELAAKRQQLIQYEGMLFNFRKQKFITSKTKYNNIENSLFSSAQIILTTLASTGNDKIDKVRGEIACLIVDQAAQATEPNLLIALQTGVQKVILIGDPYQLPATVISPDANVTLFNRSLFERFLDANIKPYFLNIQYRMTPIIRAFPSSRFYHDRLLDADSVKQRPIPQFLENFEGRNVLFIDLKYGRDDRRGDSFCNYAQAEVISLLIQCLMDKSVTLGIITPYQAQRRAIFKNCMEALKEKPAEQQYLQKKIMINTVDSFQGQQKDIIIVSTVRANSTYNVGFLTDERRINVTLTRAKHLLIVIGHADTLGSNEVWDDFLTWTQQKQCYYQIPQQRYMEEMIGDVFQKINESKIRRKKHSKLSTDVRNIYRNQIQSNDFKSKRQAQFERYIKQQERIQNTRKPKQTITMSSKATESQKIVNQKKYAMNIADSEQILKDKKKKEEEQNQFQKMLERMKKLEEENYEHRFY